MKLVKGEPAPLKLVSFSREFFGSRRPSGQHRAGGAYEEIFSVGRGVGAMAGLIATRCSFSLQQSGIGLCRPAHRLDRWAPVHFYG